ncbi:uncharacterized protein LOC132067516 isoform X2 [Lycium ferocissimum]|uniref:uncharacterized protein LOC132067516 isoform X2 n=1 Tax=Lycium ferocissimum TaxID=112874 RepID=UPI00281589B5|nr:uncharacterized protein LOC132067516 isoform X2 [Lycium ferocissimum]
MSVKKIFMTKPHFNKMFLSQFMYRTLTWFVYSLWGFLCWFVFKIFFFLEKYIDRIMDGDDFKRNDSDFSAINSQKDEQLDCKNDKKLEFDETESSGFVQSKYEYISRQDSFGFMEKPEATSFSVQEMFVKFNEGVIMPEKEEKKEIVESIHDHSQNSEKKVFYFSFFNDGNSGHQEHAHDQEKTEVFDGKEANDQEKTVDHVENICCEEEILKQNDEVFSDEETQNSEDICYEIQLFPKNQSLSRISIGDEAFITSDVSYSDGHLNGFLNIDQLMEADKEENDGMGFIELETSLHNSRSSIATDEFASKNVDTVEVTNVNCEEMKLMDDFQESPSWDTDEFAYKNVDKIEETELMDDLQEFSDHNSSRKSWDTDSDDDDEDECDILLEHQNLVKQMKMEMKNSRIAGLPTISEDCESPKVVEDLKPLKIDEKIGYKDCMEEIQMFYKSYAEKMRKLDILNYQTLNAISFLQLKDSEVFLSSKKSSISITKAFTLPSFLANKQRKIFADPALNKSISEMNRDLEIVYVGQICLSWEILCWKYGKAKELLEHDPHEYHTYNQVAGEYQQFQVLVQRFLEDEPFQGPRVQNYVRKRCMLRSFLQVPSIRDDRSKEKQGGHEGEKDIISIVKLAEIIKETMQVFWEFLRADKHEVNLALKGVQGTQMDNAEIELFMNVKLDFQKKERKLKDIQRSGNCIVKKFQKQQQGRLSHSAFASLVELKLISRVLSLPRLRRDYLLWCQKKISNINVAGRKVSMEQSFSLFPC